LTDPDADAGVAGMTRSRCDQRRRALYGATRLLLRAATRSVWPVTRSGLDNIPPSGAVILAANHISFFDTVVLIGIVNRPITFVGKAEYLDNWKTRTLFPALGMIPIDRSRGRAALVALAAATSVLDDGGVLAIFPEGTRSRDGLLHEGHTGVARLALRTGAPTVPIGIIGIDAIQPPDAKAPRPFKRCHVRVGQPIDASEYHQRADGRRRHQELTDHIMRDIARLCGQTDGRDTPAAYGVARHQSSRPRTNIAYT
jgi:1-acyl-sn-glycerol-3-phosphate acyltransferase